MLPQSTSDFVRIRRASGRGMRRRSTPRPEGSTPTTCQDPVGLGELDLVGADEVRADDVDEMARLEIAGQQQLAGPTFETAELERRPDQLHEPRSHRFDPVDRDEQLPSGDAGDEPGDRRVRLSAEPDDQVLDVPDAFPRRVGAGF